MAIKEVEQKWGFQLLNVWGFDEGRKVTVKFQKAKQNKTVLDKKDRKAWLWLRNSNTPTPKKKEKKKNRQPWWVQNNHSQYNVKTLHGSNSLGMRWERQFLSNVPKLTNAKRFTFPRQRNVRSYQISNVNSLQYFNFGWGDNFCQ